MSSFAQTSLNQIIRLGRVQARRTARQVRGVSSSFAVGASASVSANAGTRACAKRMSFLEWYSAKLDAHPLLTKCITSGLIAATGDILCQAVVPVEEKEENQNFQKSSGTKAVRASSSTFSFAWDPWRTLRFAAVGTFWVAPVVHHWYAALTHRLLPGAGTPLRIVQRVAADQLCFGPVFTSSFMSILWLLEGRWQDDAKGTLNTLVVTMPGILINGLKVWVPATIINFGFVPFKYQVLYNNVLSLFWNAYLSYMSSNAAGATVKDGGDIMTTERTVVLHNAATTTTLAEDDDAVLPTTGHHALLAK